MSGDACQVDLPVAGHSTRKDAGAVMAACR